MAISPSAIEKYGHCQRQYAFTYVCGEWDNAPPGPSTQAGSQTHRALELWFTEGLTINPGASMSADIFYNAVLDRWRFTKDHPGPGWKTKSFTFRTGELAAKILTHVGSYKTVLSEHKFTTKVEGVEFKGVIDLLTDQEIIDFKTTGSSLEYAKTDRKLLNDVQRLLYAAAFPDRPRSRWITGEWHKLDIQVGERDNVPADRERFKLHVLTPAEEMLALTPGMDPLSLPLPGKQDKYTGLTKACTAFGQTCKFVDRCFPKKRQKLTLPTRTAPDAILDELTAEAQRLKMGYEPPLVTDRVLPEKSTNDVSARIAAGLASAELYLAVGEFAGSGESDVLTRTALFGSEPRPLLMDKLETRTGAYTFPVRLNLTDGQLSNPKTAFVLGAPEDLYGKGVTEISKLTEEFGGYKNEMTKKYLIENLYIDCMPIVPYPPGEALEYSYEYIAAAGQEVAGDMGVVSPMLVDFGKGPHLVTAQVIAHLSDRAEPIKHLFLETRSAEGRACMQELTSRSKFVVKGSY